MEPGDIAVARTLPIDGALLGNVLLRLRRDTEGAAVQWTLGDHGTAELDVNFVPDEAGWRTAARLWQRNRLAVVTVTFALRRVADDTLELRLETVSDLPEWWRANLDAFVVLARAFVDELAEELLWHATHAGVS